VDETLRKFYPDCMKLRRWLIKIAGVLLCWLWFEIITPRYGDTVRLDYELNNRVLLAWLIGWVLILGATLALLNQTKDKPK
jgi:hypothetical protein